MFLLSNLLVTKNQGMRTKYISLRKLCMGLNKPLGYGIAELSHISAESDLKNVPMNTLHLLRTETIKS